MIPFINAIKGEKIKGVNIFYKQRIFLGESNILLL